MKKTRLIFGAAALTLALASAFAFKARPVIEYGYWDGDSCEEASVCQGNATTCKQNIGGSDQDIRELIGATQCGELQRMDSN